MGVSSVQRLAFVSKAQRSSRTWPKAFLPPKTYTRSPLWHAEYPVLGSGCGPLGSTKFHSSAPKFKAKTLPETWPDRVPPKSYMTALAESVTVWPPVEALGPNPVGETASHSLPSR